MKSLILASLFCAPLLSQSNGPAVATLPTPAPAPQVKAAASQDSADTAREIWDTGFLKKRPSSSQNGTHSHPSPRYSLNAQDSGSAPAIRKLSQAAIGLTIWRLRAPKPADREGSRLLVPELNRKGSSVELVPERVDSATALHVGDRIRLSIEVPHPGFLYVIDRERYSDGTTGEPTLIFPLLSINHGNNEVAAGRVIEIPPQNSDIRALYITRSSDRYIGEDLMLLVTPQPLHDISLSEEARPLDSALVERWDRDWSSNSLILNQDGGQRQVWSAAEQHAGEQSGPLLTQADPLPQTIVSTAPHSPARPILVRLPLYVQ